MSSSPAHVEGSRRPGGERALGVPPAINKKDPNYICEREGGGDDSEGEDNNVAYSQDRYICHVLYIHDVDNVAVESMHGTSTVYPAPNSKEAEKDDEKTMVLRMQQKA